MTDKNADEPLITYTVALMGPDRWFVDSSRGTSGYSFRSLPEAQRFAITLAQRNTPSKVCILDSAGEVVTETVYRDPPAVAP